MTSGRAKKTSILLGKTQIDFLKNLAKNTIKLSVCPIVKVENPTKIWYKAIYFAFNLYFNARVSTSVR